MPHNPNSIMQGIMALIYIYIMSISLLLAQLRAVSSAEHMSSGVVLCLSVAESVHQTVKFYYTVHQKL